MSRGTHDHAKDFLPPAGQDRQASALRGERWRKKFAAAKAELHVLAAQVAQRSEQDPATMAEIDATHRNVFEEVNRLIACGLPHIQAGLHKIRDRAQRPVDPAKARKLSLR
jgi:hypothetical protein